MENSDISHLVDGNGLFKKGASEEIEKIQLFEALQRNPDLVDGWISAIEAKFGRKRSVEEKISVPISITVANPDPQYVFAKSKVVNTYNKVDRKELVAAYR